MKIQATLASVFLFGSLGAFAAGSGGGQSEDEWMRNHDEVSDLAVQCPELGLSEAQREELKALKEESKAAFMAQKEAYKQAKEAFVQSLTAANATDQSQRALAQTKREAGTALFNVVIDAHEKAFFDVLELDQRKAGHDCMLRAKEEMKQRYLERECRAVPRL